MISANTSSTSGRRCCRFTLLAAATMCLLLVMTSSLPVRPKRHAEPGGHRRRTERPSSAAGRYHLPRPDNCRHDDDLFRHCYLCGKLIEDVRIYNGCCAMRDIFQQYCDALLM